MCVYLVTDLFIEENVYSLRGILKSRVLFPISAVVLHLLFCEQCNKSTNISTLIRTVI